MLTYTASKLSFLKANGKMQNLYPFNPHCEGKILTSLPQYGRFYHIDPLGVTAQILTNRSFNQPGQQEQIALKCPVLGPEIIC